MVVVPAVGLGALVVFGIGYVLAYAMLSKIAKRRKGAPTLYRDTLKEVAPPDSWTEEDIDGIAKVGGVVAVVVVLLLLFVVPREWSVVMWLGLTAIGILGGLLTFALNEPVSRAQTRPPHKPPASSRVPPAREAKSRPTESTREPPSVKEDPYRNLLAKAKYDQGLADRLIEYERKRMPYASLDDLCRSALARLEQGNKHDK